MKAILVRVGIDCVYGGWNAPMNPETNEFIYVPINENEKFTFIKNGNRKFKELVPALKTFCKKNKMDFHKDLSFPEILKDKSMNLDPDFAERLQAIIDNYNSGGSSTENYYEDLMTLPSQ